MPRSISPAWRRSAMREGTSRTREKRGSASNPCTSGTAFRYDTTPNRNGLNAEDAEERGGRGEALFICLCVLSVLLRVLRVEEPIAHQCFTTLNTVSRSMG